jgi:hypothetical protein
MDFSTISNTGVLAIAIIGIFILLAIAMASKILKSKKMTIKVGSNQFDIGSNTNTSSDKDDIMYKKRSLAETHMEMMTISLEAMAEQKIGDYRNSAISKLLFELLNKELENMILKNIMDNHVGDTPEELKIYVDIRAREYAASVISFYKRLYNEVPDEYKNICDENSYGKLENFFKVRLMKLFSDMKSLEKLN